MIVDRGPLGAPGGDGDGKGGVDTTSSHSRCTRWRLGRALRSGPRSGRSALLR